MDIPSDYIYLEVSEATVYYMNIFQWKAFTISGIFPPNAIRISLNIGNSNG